MTHASSCPAVTLRCRIASTWRGYVGPPNEYTRISRRQSTTVTADWSPSSLSSAPTMSFRNRSPDRSASRIRAVAWAKALARPLALSDRWVLLASVSGRWVRSSARIRGAVAPVATCRRNLIISGSVSSLTDGSFEKISSRVWSSVWGSSSRLPRASRHTTNSSLSSRATPRRAAATRRWLSRSTALGRREMNSRFSSSPTTANTSSTLSANARPLETTSSHRNWRRIFVAIDGSSISYSGTFSSSTRIRWGCSPSMFRRMRHKLSLLKACWMPEAPHGARNRSK
mmetsp:Transcript_17111/g.30558  ORF Transcript_17111/g.30558 Transcript_17111/m.30558 type:complete len:285 (-) Transcript_17111:198-1052(-)